MVICDNSKDSPKIGVLRLAHRSRSWPLLRTRPWYPQRGQPIPTGGRYDREAPIAACQRGGCGVRPVGARCQCQRDAVPARWGRCQAGGCAVSVSARCGVSAVGAVPSRWVRGVSVSAMCARPGVSAVGARYQRCGCGCARGCVRRGARGDRRRGPQRGWWRQPDGPACRKHALRPAANPVRGTTCYHISHACLGLAWFPGVIVDMTLTWAGE